MKRYRVNPPEVDRKFNIAAAIILIGFLIIHTCFAEAETVTGNRIISMEVAGVGSGKACATVPGKQVKTVHVDKSGNVTKVDMRGNLPATCQPPANACRGEFNWLNQPRETKLTLSPNCITALKIRTTANAQLSGYFIATMAKGKVTASFSENPTGGVANLGQCAATGQRARLLWNQKVPTYGNQCNLKRNRVYYIQLKPRDCGASCKVTITTRVKK